MWQRRRVSIVFTVDKRFKFSGNCSASVNVDKYGELVENICEDVEDLEDVEFLEVIGKEHEDEDIPNEEDITEEDIDEIRAIYL